MWLHSWLEYVDWFCVMMFVVHSLIGKTRTLLNEFRNLALRANVIDTWISYLFTCIIIHPVLLWIITFIHILYLFCSVFVCIHDVYTMVDVYIYISLFLTALDEILHGQLGLLPNSWDGWNLHLWWKQLLNGLMARWPSL